MDSGSLTPLTGVNTPTDTPSPFSRRALEGITFTPRRAMASFDNLVALANHQEKLKEARKIIWRDRGEPVVELPTLKACLEHAAAGALRQDLRLAVIRHVMFGLDTLRFGLMIGTFTSIYKFLLNALPLLIPALNHPPTLRPRFKRSDDSSETPFLSDAEEEDGPTAEHPTTTLRVPLSKRNARLSLSTEAQLALIRKKTKRWHAAIAGGIAGGLAIIWETRGRRGVIAQQLFVRGLQASYNAYTTKRNIRVPNGDVLVFALACGQIVYGFLLRPDTLPHSYHTWIGQAAKVPPECVTMNHDLVRQGSFNVTDLDRLTSRKDITPSNYTDLLSLRSLLLSPPDPSTLTDPIYFPHYAPCSAVHPALTSCASVPLDRFFAVFKWMLPIYGALHFVPAVLFKRAAFMQDPGKVLVRAGLGSLRSSAFLGVCVVMYQSIYCYKHKLHKFLTLLRFSKSPSLLARVPTPLVEALISKASFWFPGFIAGLSLFVEEKRRRGELAMYVLPKGLESLWVMLRGKGIVFKTGNWGESALTALGMAMVMVSVPFYLSLSLFPSGEADGLVFRARIRMIHSICLV
ncbi:hypothetical protein C0991_000661 [Blastosporella zonata]|nr:hypothetical protein C0991_000661 [Blastosporella zonata]